MLHDLLGLTSGYVPRFVRQYADLRSQIAAAVAAYCRDVADGSYPDSRDAPRLRIGARIITRASHEPSCRRDKSLSVAAPQ